MQPVSRQSQGGADPAYAVELPCPACASRNLAILLRAKQTLTLSIPGHPFLRAFAWSEERNRLELSPLYFGAIVCAGCRFPGQEGEFRASDQEGGHPRRATLQRLFVTEAAGRSGPVADTLGPDPEALREPERTLRILLAAIRAGTLPYPEFWNHAELGRLHLRLVWLFLDELHLDWTDVRPASPPRCLEDGPNAPRFKKILAELESIREFWPDAPLDECALREGALRFHREAFERRVEEPEAVQAVLEEWELAGLHGLTGDVEQAREILLHARLTCASRKEKELRRQKEAFENATLTMGERRALSTRIQRLGTLYDEIGMELRVNFGVEAVPLSRQRLAAARSAPAATAAAAARQKKRFRLF